MALPAGALSTTPPSVRARVSYAFGRRAVGPLVRRYFLSDRKRPIGDRLSTAGRSVAAVSRLQRRRPFAHRLSADRHTVGNITVETVRVGASAAPLNEGAVLYFHGGGFFVGNLDSHLHVAAIVARRTQLPVVHVDYRQHPETTIDKSVEDCLSAYRWLLEQGVDPAKVVFAGDSAGGFLAFATVLAAQRAGLAVPAGVVGISPVLDLDCTARNSHENATRDPVHVGFVLALIVECARPPADSEDLSPVNGNLEAFPPALIIVAETEALRCDAERMYDVLAAAGRSCTLRVWPRQLHAFPALFPFLPESKAAFDVIAQFMQERLANPETLPMR